MKDYDVIIVGAGTAGCVLASRLSEKPSRDVLLIDAGHHYPTINEFPTELLRASYMPATMPGHPSNWSFVGSLTPGRKFSLPRGKVVGGSSAINGGYFIRGRRQDFEEWARLGNEMWSYQHVLPYFVRSETDLDFSSEFHGESGPIPVRRTSPDRMHPVSQAFYEASLNAGFPENPDKNSDEEAGIGPIPHNCVNGVRMNTSITYLAAGLGRTNLTVFGDTFVRRVLFSGTRAIGVEVIKDGKLVQFHAGEIVLSAGAIKTPHVLMLSGVGPADMIRQYGIQVIHDSVGVGRNVKDNPSVLVPFRVQADGAEPQDFMPLEACLNYTAENSDTREDLEINCRAASYDQMIRRYSPSRLPFTRLPSYLARPAATIRGLHHLPLRFVIEQARDRNDLNLMCSLEREGSSGQIRLVSSDATVAPDIQLNYLSEPEDISRLRENVRTAVNLLRSPRFGPLHVKLRNLTNEDLTSDSSLNSWIIHNLSTAFHTSCSARMGLPSDPEAVVDQYCRVHGVDALRVVDISIMPTGVRRGPAATAIMIGERAADFFE